MISLQNITKKYGSTIALQNFSLTVNDGELVGLVGADGSGKTSVLHIILGLLIPDEGTVSVHNRPTGRGICGYVSQGFSLYGDLTVLENVLLMAHLYGKDRDGKESAERVLRFTEMWPFRDRLAKHLSGGMRQKLSLASALVHRPETLILDEPNTGIDAVSRREFWQMLNRINKEGTTIVLATPYFDEGEYCPKVVLLHKGRELTSGAPDELRQRYDSERLEDVFWKLTKGERV